MKRTAISVGCRFSPAERTGMGAIALSVPLALLNPHLATVPLAAFLMLCVIAPFVPRFGFFLPVVSRGRCDGSSVALTFDDGPDPLTTPALLEILERHGVRATFFIPGRKAENHPDLIRAILSRGHTIGNHSYSHDNCIMLKSSRTLQREILNAQRVFQRFGITPLAFRPPVGITNPRLAKALSGTDLFVVNFSRSAWDWGNRHIRNLSRRILKRLRPGDIVLLHDTPPPRRDQFSHWRNEIQKILTGIHSRGLSIEPLERLIGRPVMRTTTISRSPGPRTD